MESPGLIVALGLLIVTIAGVVYSQLRTGAAQLAIVAAALLAVAAIALERSWITPAESARAAVHELLARIEANDLAGVLRLIDPSAADMRSDAQTLMPMFAVESAGAGSEVRVDVAPGGDVATAELKPLLKVRHKSSGATGVYFDGLRLDLAWRDDRWLFVDYQPAEDWRDGAARLAR